MNIPIKDKFDIITARKMAQELSSKVGCDEKCSQEIALIVEELAENIIKHALLGSIVLQPIQNGMQITSVSRCGDLPELNKIITDGYSTAGSLGLGLGIIKKLSDEFTVTTGEKGELIFQVIKLVSDAPSNVHCEVSAFSFPLLLNAEQNGDAFVVKKTPAYTLLAIIDALGHGYEAYLTSKKTVSFIEKNHNLPLLNLMEGLHTEMKGTRGAAVGLLKVDTAHKKGEYAGIGNTEILIYPAPVSNHPYSLDGTVGREMRKINICSFDLAFPVVFILFTDGISSKLGFKHVEEAHKKTLQEIGWFLINKFRRSQDDATLLLCRMQDIKR